LNANERAGRKTIRFPKNGQTSARLSLFFSSHPAEIHGKRFFFVSNDARVHQVLKSIRRAKAAIRLRKNPGKCLRVLKAREAS